jgi:hypothetical protein
MSGWTELSAEEDDSVWKEVSARFRFTPSVRAEVWPGFRPPSPFITWSIPDPWSEAAMADLDARALEAFRKTLAPGARMFALDWQHPSFWFSPHQPLEPWLVPVLPNGDYCLFLAPGLEWGWFGHPWEQSLCVFGEPLLGAVLASPPRLLSEVLRQG